MEKFRIAATNDYLTSPWRLTTPNGLQLFYKKWWYAVRWMNHLLGSHHGGCCAKTKD